MPKRRNLYSIPCPKCKKDIVTLVEIRLITTKTSFWLDERLITIKTTFWLDEYDFWIEDSTEKRHYEILHYDCPECKEILFKNPSEARKFLKGEVD